MKAELVEQASKIIPEPQMLINVVSRRVAQLNNGRAPLVPTTPHILRNDRRRDVLRHTGAAANHHMRTNDAELMDCGHAADDREVVNRYVTRQRCVVGEDAAVTYRTIVRNVRVDHQ